MRDVHYIRVIVPLRLEWTPTYRCCEPLEKGCRVSVPLGRRTYVGVVLEADVQPDIEESRIQDIIRAENGLPRISGQELEFWSFLASYYICTIGEIYKAAYPYGKIRSEQKAEGILERLRSRLAVREEALKGKHKDSVRERLESERAALIGQIEALTKVSADVPVRKAAAPKPVLLQGSGRTEVYIEECRRALEKGFNVLVLTPEIAAGKQLSGILEDTFPGQVHLVNARIPDARRRRISDDVRRFGAQIVVGSRSALFLPLSRLALIIVDNEQDSLFKQTEPAPRYNARDAAVMLGRIHCAKVILGSAAPSLESYYNALNGKYILRQSGAPAPPMTIVDISAERRKNGMIGRISRKLLDAARGCGGPVALVRSWEKPDELLEETARLFNGLQVDVLSVHEARLSDLGRYPLVAVLQADALFPEGDFRADERAVQALAVIAEQCSGTFLVQTAKAEHPVFSNQEHIYRQLLSERRQFNLPPFSRLVQTLWGSRSELLTFAPDKMLGLRKQELWQRALAFEKKTKGRVRVIIDVDPI